MSSLNNSRFGVQLSVITLARLLLNTGLRMVYPFAPALARGLGLPVTDIYRLVSLRNLTGFLSPLFSPLSERYGRKPVMIGTLVLFSLGCLVVVIWPGYWTLGVTLSVIALTKVIFDPAMQSYVGERVPYGQRGKALAVTELAWAGSLLVGAPAIGFVIARQGWQAPFFWLALLGIGAVGLLWRLVPRTHAESANGAATLGEVWRILRRQRVIWAANVYMILVSAANETILIVYGDWMEISFGLSLVALGLTAGVIGSAEVVGEVAAGWSVDRFGKRPVIITTGLLNAGASVLLPFTGSSLTVALPVYFLLFLFFEITIVGGVPLFTEIVPGARAVVMSSVLAASALGRAFGAWLGPVLFASFDFVGNGLVAAALMIVGIVILGLWVREGIE